MTSAVLETRGRRSPVADDTRQLIDWSAAGAESPAYTPSAEPSLDLLLTQLWSALERGEQGMCPVCAGAISPQPDAAGGCCGGCGAYVS